MAITLFGTASNPADNGTNTANPTVVTPPSNMLEGDLVWLIASAANTSGDNSISETGGQTWTALAQVNQTRNRVRCFWCRFDGTWTANPSVTMAGTANNIVRMLVFRGSYGTLTRWEHDAEGANDISGTYSAPTSPYTVTINFSQPTDWAILGIATWTSRDANTWGSLTAGWNALTPAQVRNTSGSFDQSITNAWQATPYALGYVAQNQVDLAPDAGTYRLIFFRELVHLAGQVEAASSAVATAGRIFSLAGAVSAVSSAIGKVTKPDRLKGIYTWLVKSPAVGGIPGPKLPANAEIEEISSYVVSGTSATFNVESRAACESAGDNILASDQAADADGTSATSFSVYNVAKGRWLWLDISAVDGSPTQLLVTVKFTQYIETVKELVGAVAAYATAVAKATILHAARAVVNATSSVVGFIKGTLKSAGTGHIAATSSAVARLTGTILLSGSIAAASSVGGTAGRTLCAAGSISASSTAVARAAEENKVYQYYTWVVKTPAVGGIPGPKIPKTATVIEISSYVTAATSATFNIERRASPEAAGTNYLASDQVADADGTTTSTFDVNYVTEDMWLWLDISAVDGTPGQLSVTISAYYSTEETVVTQQGSVAATSSVTGAASRIFSLKGSVAATSSVVATATPQTNIRKDFHTFVLSNVATGVVAGPKLPEQIEIQEVSGYIVGGTGATFSLQLRATPNVAVSSFMTSPLTVGTSGASTTAFDSSVGNAGQYLFLNITHLDGTPTQLAVTVKYLPNPAVKGRIVATSSVIGKITCEKKVAGSIASAFGTTGDFVRARYASAQVVVSSSSGATGAVTIMVAAAGSIEATSSVIGDAGFKKLPAGEITATSSVSGAASVLKPVAGTVAATSLVSGVVRKTGEPAGRIAATSSVIGYADQRDRARGRIDAASSVIGDATIMYEHRAAGTVAGASTAVAKFTYVSGGFAGTVAAASSAVASAIVFKPIRIWVKIGGTWRLSGGI